ncbi:hypothetical protein NC652_004912 [Populus alba x Populus x berolinensis]|nr:hypothetical protein NC652_004912 [Populus alba x Populus x berolinensis]
MLLFRMKSYGRECEELDAAVNEAREFMEKWCPQMSRICSVQQSEALLKKIQSSALEICQGSPTTSSLTIVQELQGLKHETITEIIEEALRSLKDDGVPCTDHLMKLIETLGLTSNQELLKESVAVEKGEEKMKARALLEGWSINEENVEAPSCVDGIDLQVAKQRLNQPFSEKQPSRKGRSRGDSQHAVSQHSASLVLEAIYLKAKSLQKLGDAAHECKRVLDAVEKNSIRAYLMCKYDNRLQDTCSRTEQSSFKPLRKSLHKHEQPDDLIALFLAAKSAAMILILPQRRFSEAEVAGDDRVNEYEVWHGLADLYSRLSHWKDMEDPSYVRCKILIGALLSKRDSNALPVARSILSDALKIEPTNRMAWYYLGIIHRVDGRIADAADCFQAASMLEESDPIENFSSIL